MKIQQLQLDKINTNHLMDDKKYTLLDSEKQPTGEFSGIELKRSSIIYQRGDDYLSLINGNVYNNEGTLLIKGYKSHYEKNNTLYITDFKNDIFKVKRNANYFHNTIQVKENSNLITKSISNIIGENLSVVSSNSTPFFFQKKCLVIDLELKAIFEYSLNNEKGEKLFDVPDDMTVLINNDTIYHIIEETNHFHFVFLQIDPTEHLTVFTFQMKNSLVSKAQLTIPQDFFEYPNVILDMRMGKNILYVLIANIDPSNNIDVSEYIFQVTGNTYTKKNIIDYKHDEYTGTVLTHNIAGKYYNNKICIGFSLLNKSSIAEEKPTISSKLKEAYKGMPSYNEMAQVFLQIFQQGSAIAESESDRLIGLEFPASAKELKRLCDSYELIQERDPSTKANNIIDKAQDLIDNQTAENKYIFAVYFNVFKDYQLISSHYELKLTDLKAYDKLQIGTVNSSVNENYYYINGKEYYFSYTFIDNFPINSIMRKPTKEFILELQNTIPLINENLPTEFSLGTEIFNTGHKKTLSLGLEFLLGQNFIFYYNLKYAIENKAMPLFSEQKAYKIDILTKENTPKSISYTNTMPYNQRAYLFRFPFNFSDIEYTEDDPPKLSTDKIEMTITNAKAIFLIVATDRGTCVVFEDDPNVIYFLDFYNQQAGEFHGESEAIKDITNIQDGTFIATNSKLSLQKVIGTNEIEYYMQDINIGYDIEMIGEKIICYFVDNILKYVYENSIIEMLYPIDSPPKKVIKKKNVLLLQDTKNRIWLITPKERSFALLSLSEEKELILDSVIKDEEGNIYNLENGNCKFRFSYSRGTTPIVLKKISSYSTITGGSVLFEDNRSQKLNVVKWRDKSTLPCSIATQRHKQIQIDFDENIGNNITIEYI